MVRVPTAHCGRTRGSDRIRPRVYIRTRGQNHRHERPAHRLSLPRQHRRQSPRVRPGLRGVDHQHVDPRAVCFHLGEWGPDLEEDSVVTVDYEREKTDIDELPPMLVGIESIDVVEQRASPDVLFDL
ncbi:hypothetical protein [Halomontanus rarus]|uniref:hypothetical protein n=1 Tax=Halomontanus rarus TaxID=3034020 RepID=UPI0023E77BC1|nr:hypothetical protein [Halovivax sp. TS33]